MKNITRHYGILELIERMDNSVNGNPRFELAVMDANGKGLGWSFRTLNDAMVNFQLESWLGQPVEVEIGTHYGKPTCNWLSR